jgi:phage virion morphogenesis protein
MIFANIDSDALTAALENLEDALSTEAILTQAGDTLIDLIGLGFTDQQDPWGNAWAPLSARSRSGQPLRDTGRLMNSIDKQISGNTLTVGTNVCYGLVHQFGATVTAQKPTGNNICNYTPKGAKRLAWSAGGAIHFAKSVTIPARPFMPIQPGGGGELPASWDDEIGESIASMIQRAIK